MASRKGVLNEALQLPRADRADVAQRLIASLDEGADEDVGAAWLDEVERRLCEVNDGTVVPEPWASVRDRIRARILATRQGRMHYGVHEWVNEATESGPHRDALRKVAWRIVTQKEFRDELLSHDASLKAFWR